MNEILDLAMNIVLSKYKKTIKEMGLEERVKKYSPDSIWPDMVWQIRDIDLVDYKRISYIDGAKEQKDIDDIELLTLKSELEEKEAQIKQQYKQGYHDAIERFCEWLDIHFMEIGYLDDWMRNSQNIEIEKENLIKAIEEQV